MDNLLLTRAALSNHRIETLLGTDGAQHIVEVLAAVMVRPALLHAYAGCGQQHTAGSDKDGQGDGEFLAHGCLLGDLLADADELMP